jgi:hypothetical protein
MADAIFPTPAPVGAPARDITQAVTSSAALADATDRLTTARVLTSISNDVKSGRVAPLIEIKGLGAAVQAAKQGIAGVRGETAGLSIDAALLMTAIQGVRKQITQAREDLKFEAETLGNGNGSDNSGETSK